MSAAVWAEVGTAGWTLLTPVGFKDEAALHDLVEANPALLPLSGNPQLAVIGREVSLGPGFADLMAVEPTGRLTIIEVKLSQNPEAKRSIVAQILSYAASLRGLSRSDLAICLNPYLVRHNVGLLDEGLAGFASDVSAFVAGIDDSLATGRFRLVLVLDSPPPDLVRLVGYLETIGDHLTIDLVQVTAYEIDGTKILVPQRVDPERLETPAHPAQAARPGEFVRSPDLFDTALDALSGDAKAECQRLRSWAGRLMDTGVARLDSYRGPSYTTLLVRLVDEDAGPVTVYNDGSRAFLGVYRQVLERRSPASLTKVEQAALPLAVGRGTSHFQPSDELLEALACSYREAAAPAPRP